MGLTVLDAGVVIAALDGADPHHEAAARGVRAAGERGDSLVLPASAYAEILVRPAALGANVVAAVDEALDGAGVAVVPADRGVARRAAGVRSGRRGLRLPDALVVATAIELGAGHLLTTDRGWPPLAPLGYEGVLEILH